MPPADSILGVVNMTLTAAVLAFCSLVALTLAVVALLPGGLPFTFAAADPPFPPPPPLADLSAATTDMVRSL